MNFTSGRNTEADSVFIRYDGDFTKTGTLNVYETEMTLDRTRIIFDSNHISPVRFTNQILQDSYGHDILVYQYTGLIRMQKYSVFCNSINDIKIINAHYGNLHVGGIEFRLADVVASSNSDYAYEIPMYAYDLPVMLTYINLDYKISQNLVFDIADYKDNRRIGYDTIQSANQFGKLSVSTDLIDNELHVSCIDTKGQLASVHIANDLGLSDTTIQCSVKITVHGLNEDGETVIKYSNIVANEDYSDATIVYYLPNINENVVVCNVLIDYIISMHTLSNDIVLRTNRVLSDQQLSQLRFVRASDL